VGLPVAEVLEDFGVFIAPALMKMFRHLLLPEWKTIGVRGKLFTIAKRCCGRRPHLWFIVI